MRKVPTEQEILGYPPGNFIEIACERLIQDEKWGEQNHESNKWCAILGEEFGEACKCVLKPGIGDTDELRAELIQIAAVAVAWIECIDRRVAKQENRSG